MTQHKYYSKVDRRDSRHNRCMVCDGWGFALTRHCPGRKITQQEADDIIDRKTMFYNGEWQEWQPEVYPVREFAAKVVTDEEWSAAVDRSEMTCNGCGCVSGSAMCRACDREIIKTGTGVAKW